MQINPTELGQLAYKAYGGAVNNRNHQGLPLPEWDDLGPQITTAWEVAAEAVARKALRLAART
ncbi:hypothetical protein [Streptomyces mirabilis]|uniref:hypothetical protein n=1 Tax=Streptomyces mirabilis TaxID=68239 RepID=UPI00367A8957